MADVAMKHDFAFDGPTHSVRWAQGLFPMACYVRACGHLCVKRAMFFQPGSKCGFCMRELYAGLSVDACCSACRARTEAARA